METKDETVFCAECGAKKIYGHGPFCTEQNKEQMLSNIKYYYNKYVKEQNKIHLVKKEITFWQGKFNMVVTENNKLRRKFVKIKGGNND